MTYSYRPTGVCSQLFTFELENGVIHNMKITGGCNGNLQGICRLLEGMDAKEAISRMAGVRCGFKPTSCPDQISKALSQALGDNG